MVQLAYAVARSSSVESPMPARRMVQGAAPRRMAAPTSLRGSRIALGLLAVALLVVIGGVAARALDSTLLGFVFADLVFLVSVALRSAVAPSKGPSARTR